MKCIIVEDELPAIKVIQNHISHFSDLDLIGTYNNAMDAFVALKKNQGIDIVFLDIQLPQMSGIQLLNSLNKYPSIIITTAHREFAIDGYDLEITDFLLKPISLGRFTKAINKIYKQHLTQLKAPRITEENKSSIFSEPLIYVRVNKQNVKIKLKDIRYIESIKNHVKIYKENEFVTTLVSLSQIEERLPEHYFQRIHRSYIVGLEHISKFTQSNVIILDKSIPIGGFYKQQFNKRVQEFLL